MASIYLGKFNEYHFLQTAKEGCSFKRFVTEFEELLLRKAVAVLSFDGDSMKPTEEEYRRGWSFDDKEVAYFEEIDSYELKTAIFANCYDEWYVFEEPSKLKTNHIYVTYSGFRLINYSGDIFMDNLIARFWKDVEINNPMSFIIYGDNFIYGSKNQEEINELSVAWR